MLVPTNLANQDGSTALTAAAHKGHIDTVRLLLDAGADKHLADKGSSTALMLASQVGHRESLGLILGAGEGQSGNKRRQSIELTSSKRPREVSARPQAFKRQRHHRILQPLRLHVPKWYILWPHCTYIGSTLRPMYILFGYMDPASFCFVSSRYKSWARVIAGLSYGPESGCVHLSS